MPDPASVAARDDLFADGIALWSSRVRRGELSFEATVQHCLDAIAHADNAMLDAFEIVDEARALETARAHDALLAAGTDLGPLMGLPIGVKDIFACDGLPITNGSNLDTAALSGSEGSVVATLRHAGAIVLGKTRTVEFALGSSGVNTSRGTPWNPADREVHRIPGGSSSGSAVATAAGLVGMALGSDTGGSVRIPACFTGIVGHKTSVGRWPTDGVLSLSHTLDTIGPLCRRVDDAGLLHTLMTGEPVTPRASVAGLRFAAPPTLFLETLDDAVAADFARARGALIEAGAIEVGLDFPAVTERARLFADIVPAELLATLGAELFQRERARIDAVTASRAAVGLDTLAIDYVRALRRRQALIDAARRTFDAVDLWISPTCPFLPIPVADLDIPAVAEHALLASRNTQPGNLLDFCAISLPIHRSGTLPTGLQLMMPLNHDARLLGVAHAVEALLDRDET